MGVMMMRQRRILATGALLATLSLFGLTGTAEEPAVDPYTVDVEAGITPRRAPSDIEAIALAEAGVRSARAAATTPDASQNEAPAVRVISMEAQKHIGLASLNESDPAGMVGEDGERIVWRVRVDKPFHTLKRFPRSTTPITGATTSYSIDDSTGRILGRGTP